MFVSLGAHLVQADRIAHDLMLPGKPVYKDVVRHFGDCILNPDLSINRAKLADAAFVPGNPSHVEELNRLVHPAVIRRQEEWMEEIGRQDPHAIAIVEAALILEAGVAGSFDRLIVVISSDEQRIGRFGARQNLNLQAARAEVTRRMAAQLSEAEKIKAADFVIDNSGSLEETREQVKRVWEILRTAAKYEG
jgi:dephospho-CoA kinase